MRTLIVTAALLASMATDVRAEQFDATFGSGGRDVLQWGTADRRAIAMLPLPNGGVVHVSAVENACDVYCPFFAYYSATGNFVGAVSPGVTGMAGISAAAIDSRGRIVVVGTSVSTTGNRNFVVLRLLPGTTGAPDSSFGNNGKVEVDFYGLDDDATAVAIDADDNIVVVGAAGLSLTDTDFGLARLRGTDGALDTTFSGDGKALAAFDLGSGLKLDGATAVAIAASGGRISVAGTAIDSAIGRDRVALARFNRDGSLDSTFCATSCTLQGNYTAINNGRRVYYFGQDSAHTDVTTGIALLGNGDFYIAGMTYTDNYSSARGAVARLSANGNFAAEALDFGVSNFSAYRAVAVSDATGQRVLVAGESGNSADHFLMQAYSANLIPVANYGNCPGDTAAFCFAGGSGIADFGPDWAASLHLDASGRPLFTGTFIESTGAYRRSVLARFTNATGPKPDRIFRHGF